MPIFSISVCVSLLMAGNKITKKKKSTMKNFMDHLNFIQKKRVFDFMYTHTDTQKYIR